MPRLHKTPFCLLFMLFFATLADMYAKGTIASRIADISFLFFFLFILAPRTNIHTTRNWSTPLHLELIQIMVIPLPPLSLVVWVVGSEHIRCLPVY